MSEANLAELLILRKEVDMIGTTFYYNNNDEIHRIHGPAVIWNDGSMYWFRDGLLHREDGPAYISADGRKEWWLNDKFIRSEPS